MRQKNSSAPPLQSINPYQTVNFNQFNRPLPSRPVSPLSDMDEHEFNIPPRTPSPLLVQKSFTPIQHQSFHEEKPLKTVTISENVALHHPRPKTIIPIFQNEDMLLNPLSLKVEFAQSPDPFKRKIIDTHSNIPSEIAVNKPKKRFFTSIFFFFATKFYFQFILSN